MKVVKTIHPKCYHHTQRNIVIMWDDGSVNSSNCDNKFAIYNLSNYHILHAILAYVLC